MSDHNGSCSTSEISGRKANDRPIWQAHKARASRRSRRRAPPSFKRCSVTVQGAPAREAHGGKAVMCRTPPSPETGWICSTLLGGNDISAAEVVKPQLTRLVDEAPAGGHACGSRHT